MGRNEGWQVNEVLRHLCIRHLAKGGGAFGQTLLTGDNDATFLRFLFGNHLLHMIYTVKPASLEGL